MCHLSVPLKAIHMETDPQMISAYLIYLSQHAPVEEQASHNDLALVITESSSSWIRLCENGAVLTQVSSPLTLCRTSPGSSLSAPPSWTACSPNIRAGQSPTPCSVHSSTSSPRTSRGWGRPKRGRIFTAGWGHIAGRLKVFGTKWEWNDESIICLFLVWVSGSGVPTLDYRRDCYHAHSRSPCHGYPSDSRATQR